MIRTRELAFARVGLMIAGTLLTAFCSSSTERKPTPVDCAFHPAQSLGSIVNSPKFEGSPTASADETSLFFTSDRDGQQDLFVSTRPTKDAPWNEPVNLGAVDNDHVADDFARRSSSAGMALYSASN